MWRTEKPPEDDPFNKPMAIKKTQVKSNCGPNLADSTSFVGPVSDTKRDDGKADIMLLYKDKEFKVHKHVMQKASEFFEKNSFFMDVSWMPKRSKAETFDLNAMNKLPADCKPETLDRVLDFAYTGLLPLYPDGNFLDFFAVAVALKFHEALDVYRHYFRILYKSEHKVVPIRVAAEFINQSQKVVRPPFGESPSCKYLDSLLLDTCKNLFKDSLTRCIEHEEFLTCVSGDGMVALLGRDDLTKSHLEFKVLDLALAWLKHHPEDQQKYAAKLLHQIHLGVLPRERLTTLLSEIKMFLGSDCIALVEPVLKLMDGRGDASIPLDLTHPQWFAGRNEMMVNTLIGIGPAGTGGAQRLVYFNPHIPQNKLGWQDWCEFHPIPNLDFPIYDASAITINNKLYLVGGCDNTFRERPQSCEKVHAPCTGKLTTNSFYEGNLGASSYKTEETGGVMWFSIVNPWSRLRPMQFSRRLTSLVYLDGYLYAIGGIDNYNKAMKEVERYSFFDRQWEKLADLPVPCYYACAMVYKDNILVYGSQPVPDPDTPAKHDLQMYDPSTKQWANLLTEHHKILKFMPGCVAPPTVPVPTVGGGSEEVIEISSGDEDEVLEVKAFEEVATSPIIEDHASTTRPGNQTKEEKEIGSLLPRNALVVVGDYCYRVVYTPAEPSTGKSATKKCAVDKASDGQPSDGQPSEATATSGEFSAVQSESGQSSTGKCTAAKPPTGKSAAGPYSNTTVASQSSGKPKLQPLVHKLEFDLNSSTPSVKIGESQNQKLMKLTLTNEGAFQIENKVFINMKGCVHDTGIRISAGQKKKVDLGVWKKLQSKGALFEDLTVARFSFDKKTVFCEECVKGDSCTNKGALGFWAGPCGSDVMDGLFGPGGPGGPADLRGMSSGYGFDDDRYPDSDSDSEYQCQGPKDCLVM